jgi:hypothetical protein
LENLARFFIEYFFLKKTKPNPTLAQCKYCKQQQKFAFFFFFFFLFRGEMSLSCKNSGHHKIEKKDRKTLMLQKKMINRKQNFSVN